MNRFSSMKSIRQRYVMLAVGVFLIICAFTFFSPFPKQQFLHLTTSPSPVISEFITPANNVLGVNKDTLTTIPSDTVTLKLETLTPSAPDDCRDCMSQVAITVANGQEQTTITYKSGGIAGYLPKPQSAFGYTFILDHIQSDIVYIRYEKK